MASCCSILFVLAPNVRILWYANILLSPLGAPECVQQTHSRRRKDKDRQTVHSVRYLGVSAGINGTPICRRNGIKWMYFACTKVRLFSTWIMGSCLAGQQQEEEEAVEETGNGNCGRLHISYQHESLIKLLICIICPSCVLH